MDAASYTEVRKNLKHYFDKVYAEHDPVIVTRKNNENIVLLSLDDYNALKETHYLLSNEKNATKLKASLKDSRNKKLIQKSLDES